MLKDSDVEWVTNDNGELGVKIGNQFFFLYKGESLVYESGKHDDGSPMHWRHVFKSEFGECAYPINYDNPSLIGKVSLDDSDEWQELPEKMTNRLSRAQARALAKLDRNVSRSPDEIGETRATCDALVSAGYARKLPRGTWDVAYTKTKDLS